MLILIALVFAIQMLLFRSKRLWLRLLPLALAVFYAIGIVILLILEGCINTKFEVFQNWLDAELVFYEFVLFGIGESLAWAAQNARDK